MSQSTIENLHNARRNRQHAQRARVLVRADARRPSNEQLRLYASRLEKAARTIERDVVASRPKVDPTAG
jgi:hypothetical protein